MCYEVGRGRVLSPSSENLYQQQSSHRTDGLILRHVVVNRRSSGRPPSTERKETARIRIDPQEKTIGAAVRHRTSPKGQEGEEAMWEVWEDEPHYCTMPSRQGGSGEGDVKHHHVSASSCCRFGSGDARATEQFVRMHGYVVQST
jgi:hypothetical protein